MPELDRMGLQSSEGFAMYLANSQGASVARCRRQRHGGSQSSHTPPKRVVCVPLSRPLWTQVGPALALSGDEVPDCGSDGDGARDEVFVVQVLRPHGVAAQIGRAHV